MFSVKFEGKCRYLVRLRKPQRYLQNTGLCHCVTSVRETSVVDNI